MFLKKMRKLCLNNRKVKLHNCLVIFLVQVCERRSQCDKCLYGWGQQRARLTSFKLGTTRSRGSVITELCPPQNVVGVTLIRIMCCMNNTAISTYHTLPRCLGSIHKACKHNLLTIQCSRIWYKCILIINYQSTSMKKT